ncbi:energy-coupling factor ABC transporter ATP-binding protein [Paramagnetospirillum magneticum]|uniref:ABC transporter ATP-binding protein n=1 Tax=Paramagnetospirillum magneticum (strain ATCC 700264 / AMB-1) TaxID=342108 RepID=Q2WAP3_PARM1|nr:ATP-binding cassette domain-containing protein [Paramagnetospirillum magneticum]BAE49082.1 ABC-type cobalt transport system [Paramagnetospirillum magneticum AMB-1]
MILEAAGLTYRYPGGVAALSGLDLGVERGRRLAVLGPNGAGKTTLLLHLNGTLKPSAGTVRLGGEIMGYSRAALTGWRRRVGLVLQEPDDQLFAATVAEDVSFGPLNLGLSEAETRRRVEAALDALGISDLAGRATHMLSFGQKKRVAIAGALAMEPEVLLLDEPLAGLDHQGGKRLLAALDALARAGTTLVFTTHEVDLAHGFADRVALFRDGRVIAQGEAAEVLSDRECLAACGLEMPLLLELGVRTRDEALALLAVGRKVY